MAPLVLINAVGLTSRLLPLVPRFAELAKAGWQVPVREVVPAVTCTAQAAMLTGVPSSQHGIVGNGWLYRDTGEIRFWQQSNRLIQAEPIYQTLRRRGREQGRTFRCAKLFWWFNQGADVELSVTPKPHYGSDGSKVFGITGTPEGLTERLEKKLGPFPFQTFWGPLAGLPCTEWIARCAAEVVREEKPDLTLVYLPHLDYDPQRFGIKGSDMPRLLRELDNACVPLLEAARAIGARVWVVSEYGHCDVRHAVEPNRVLRRAGLLNVRPGPFGEVLDTFTSRAFAVCDHQLAHIYIAKNDDLGRVRDSLAGLEGVERLLVGEERAELGLDHPRSGAIVALSMPDAWFAYPFWLDDRLAPDYARTVAIHAKPGYDPCELYMDPHLRWPKVHVARRLVQKKLGFRTRFDVIPLDAQMVRGSHGLAAAESLDRPVMIGDGPAPVRAEIPITGVHSLLMTALSAS